MVKATEWENNIKYIIILSPYIWSLFIYLPRQEAERPYSDVYEAGIGNHQFRLVGALKLWRLTDDKTRTLRAPPNSRVCQLSRSSATV